MYNILYDETPKVSSVRQGRKGCVFIVSSSALHCSYVYGEMRNFSLCSLMATEFPFYNTHNYVLYILPLFKKLMFANKKREITGRLSIIYIIHWESIPRLVPRWTFREVSKSSVTKSPFHNRIHGSSLSSYASLAAPCLCMPSQVLDSPPQT